MKKYRIVYESINQIYKIEYKKYLFWKPLTQLIHSEQVDLIFSNLYDLEEYLKGISRDHVDERQDFCILFI